MIDAGIPMPISTRKTGSPDGIFLEETHQSVKEFQRKCGLEGADVDGIVGPITMGLFDARFAGDPKAVLPPKKKRITLNITFLHGTNINASHALAYANTIYNHQANIEIVRGNEVRLGQQETEALIGKDLMLEEHFFDHVASDEEKLLFKINQSGDAISAYFVKEIADESGSVSSDAVAYALTQGSKMGLIGVALGNRSKFQTLAHEIGHVLGVEKHSLTDESLLMTTGGPGYRLSAENIKTMRSSPFAKDV